MIRLTTLLTEAKLKLNIPSDIKKLYKLFKKNGKQLYVVGGAVRDAILGKSPKDFDLTTDAKPDEVLDIAKQGKFKSFGLRREQTIFPFHIAIIVISFFVYYGLLLRNGKYV